MSEEIQYSQIFSLSKELETEGFDLQAGQSWIYPTNYPIRDYQFNIIQKALLKNTLVSLPTGLGKTFIAAVVMYNFFRWYPLGKIIFMAPTRPLVKQQIDACYDIMAIPMEVTAELTGSKVSASREDVWRNKRVFFITPQILQNDLDKLVDLGHKIKCIVFDEAHRARGNHAYCEVIRKLTTHNTFFRVLALSATPGGRIEDVLEVIQNLLISHLEFRTEESLDVHPYVYQRNLTTVVIPLGEKLQQIKDNYLQVLEHYTRTLMQHKVIHGNCGNLTKGKMFMTMKEYQQRARGSGSAHYGEIMKSLNICVTLYHAYELLMRHGMRSFLTFFDEHIDKPLLRGNTQLIKIMEDVRNYLGPPLEIQQLPDGTYPEISKDIKFGHPKFYKLRDILLSHFTETSDSSRVIVFFEYRDSVMEAYALLIQARPTLRPRIFLGQGQGVTQRLQLNVVKSFREGHCNVLLSTCIGEEGLDVGEVDLIICFDISTKSPVRMVQRMGRTGRKKEGSIIVLVTEGKEQQTLKDCLMHKNNITDFVLSSKVISRGLKPCCPRLVPVHISPKCEKIHITVKKPVLKKRNTLKEMFRTVSRESEPSFSPDLQIVDIVERIPEPKMLWNKDNPLDEMHDISTIFSKRIEKQRNLQAIHEIKHSKSSETLVKLLQFADSKRYNIPASQIDGDRFTQNKNFKQMDIRNIFLKSQSSNEFAVPSTQVPNIFPPSYLVEEKSQHGSKELFQEISNYLSVQMSTVIDKKCRHCPDSLDCTKIQAYSQSTNSYNWIELDFSILNTIKTQDLKMFEKSLTSAAHAEFKFDDSVDFNKLPIPSTQVVALLKNGSECHIDKLEGTPELEESRTRAQMDLYNEESFRFLAPKNFDFFLTKYSTSIVDNEVSEKTLDELHAKTKSQQTADISKPVHRGPILNFFKLKTIGELFNNKDTSFDSQETLIYSPDIFEASPLLHAKIESTNNCLYAMPNNHLNDSGSPILGAAGKIWNRDIIQKRIFNKSPELLNTNKQPDNKSNLQKLVSHKMPRNQIDTPSKFTMDKTKLSSTPIPATLQVSNINKQLKFNSSQLSKRATVSDIDIGEISDILNIPTKIDYERKSIIIKQLKIAIFNSKELNEGDAQKATIDIDDLCDLSNFGLSSTKGKVQAVSNSQVDAKGNSRICDSFDINDLCDLSSFGIDKQDEKKQIDTTGLRQSPLQHQEEKTSNEQVVDLTGLPSSHMLNQPLINKSCSPSQVSITQIINLVDKSETDSETKQVTPNSSQRQSKNLISDDLDSFNFSFNSKRAVTPSAKGSKLTISKPQHRTTNLTPSKKINRPPKLSDDKGNTSKLEVKSSSTPTRKLSLNTSSRLSTIEDDFKEKHTSSVKHIPNPIKKRPFNTSSSSVASEDEFEEKPNSRIIQPMKKKKYTERDHSFDSKLTKAKRNILEYIDDEAEVSGEENISEDEDVEIEDCYEKSFVADETLDLNTQMHARYLQSVRSPKIHGQFKITRKPMCNVANVYSQESIREDDTYLDDSFIVHDDTIPVQNELSELEILEKQIEDEKRKKRKKCDVSQPPKRRKIQVLSDDSD